MHKKSTIAVTSSTKELLELLVQHDIAPFEFVSRTSSKTSDAAWIDNRSDENIVIRLRDGAESLIIPKPFHLRQVIDFLTRALKDAHTHTRTLKGMELDCLHYTLAVRGQEIHLTEKETLLLQCLMEAYPDGVSKQELLEQVWDYTQEIDSQTLPTHMYRLRQKLGTYRVILHTKGEGYILNSLNEGLDN